MKDLDKKLVSVMLLFENCEYVVIPEKDIRQIIMAQISQALLFSRHTKTLKGESFAQCDNFYLWLSPELADKEIRASWTLSETEGTGNLWTYKALFERQDIVMVDIRYDNDEVEEYRVAWPLSDDLDALNPYQSYVCDKNQFYVRVSLPIYTKQEDSTQERILVEEES